MRRFEVFNESEALRKNQVERLLQSIFSMYAENFHALENISNILAVFLVSALETKTVQQLPGHINRGSFYKKNIRIGVTCGPHFSPMELKVAEFTPAIKEFMTVPLVTPHNGAYVFKSQKPAPVALPELQLDPLVLTCRKHAGSMMTQLYDFAPTKKDEIDNIPYKLLQVFSTYYAMKSPTGNVCIEPFTTSFTEG
jgi:hypothetical protein